MIRVNTQEAKTRLSSLIASVQATGQRVVICRNGRPAAELVPVRIKDPFDQDLALQGVVFHEDPTAPLGPEDWPEAG